MNDSFLYLSAADVSLAAAEVDAVDAVREVLALHAAGQARVASEAYLAWTSPGGGDARSISMPGLLEGGGAAVGVKIINANNANPSSGLPRASGLTVIFDPETARPLCVMAAGHISALRTAAVSALSAGMLIASHATTATVISAGPLGLEHCVVLANCIPQITKVLVFDTAPQRAVRLCDELSGRLPPGRLEAEPAAAAETAVRRCDLLVTCTTTRTSYVRRDWLKDGAVAINVSLDDLAEDVLIGAARLYVDDWRLITDDQHRLLGKLARAGRVVAPGTKPAPQSRAVTGTLGQLILGQCEGRGTDADICVVNPFGMAIEDVSLAYRVYQSAQRGNIGSVLPL